MSNIPFTRFSPTGVSPKYLADETQGRSGDKKTNAQLFF